MTEPVVTQHLHLSQDFPGELVEVPSSLSNFQNRAERSRRHFIYCFRGGLERVIGVDADLSFATGPVVERLNRMCKLLGSSNEANSAKLLNRGGD